jgi:hypothetical protein
MIPLTPSRPFDRIAANTASAASLEAHEKAQRRDRVRRIDFGDESRDLVSH